MTNTSEFPAKQDVIDALNELRLGRSRSRAYRYIRIILRRYGEGARHINELDSKYYRAVFDAAGGRIPPEAFFGTVTDVHLRVSRIGETAHAALVSAAPSRTRTPMVADLEARLKERAGKPRSKPMLHVDIGAPAQFGDQADDDAARDFPAGEKLQ